MHSRILAACALVAGLAVVAGSTGIAAEPLPSGSYDSLPSGSYYQQPEPIDGAFATPGAAEPVFAAPGEFISAPGEVIPEPVPGPPPALARPAIAPPIYSQPPLYVDSEPWVSQWLPEGLIWRSYLAGIKEPRMAVEMSDSSRFGTMWDAVLGGRVAIWRYGSTRAYRPDGWEVDVEGAANPRLKPLDESAPVVSTDFRVGFPITYGYGPWQFKTGYSHWSAHLGDEWMELHPNLRRINYVRDSLMFAVGYFYTDNLRLYGEFDYAFVAEGGAQPCQLQFGFDYSPAHPGGDWFAAMYCDLREELDFGGFFVVQAGWQLRGGAALHTFRVGMQYVNGMSPQFEFYNQFEQNIGFGIWYDY